MVALSRNHARLYVGTRHVAIGGNRYEIATGPNGELLWTQTQHKFNKNVVTEAGVPYASADPNLEAPRGFFRFRDGMGFKEENIQADADTFGYEYGLYIDSGNGYIENGPAVTSVTPTTTSAGVKLLELVVGTTRKLIAVTRRYVLVRDADSGPGWVVSRDFGANVITDAAVFRGTGAARTCLIVAVSGAALWTWDGTNNTATWTQDASGDTATVLGQIREELWRAPNNYQISKTTDGGPAATWGAAFTAVDQAITITSMAGFDNRLIVGTDQGLYAPTATEDDVEELTPAFRYQRRATNGVGMKAWWDSLYVPMGGGLFRYGTDGSFPDMGLGTLQDNTSEVQGIPTALCGYNNWTLFVAYYNAVQNVSYLLRWGNQFMMETAQGTERVFVPGWHGALYKWAGVQIKDLLVTEVPDGTPYLYAVDDAGVIHFITLPRFSMEWHGDTRCDANTTNPGEVFFPRIYHGSWHEDKVNLGVACVVENLAPGARWIDISYRTTPTGTYGGSDTLEGGGRFDTDPGERKNFTRDVTSRMLQLKATLHTTSAATPAILRSIAVFQNVRTTFKWVFGTVLRISDKATTPQGYDQGRFFTSLDQRRALRTATGVQAVVTPYGDSFDMLITQLSLTAEPVRDAGPLEALATLQLFEVGGIATGGTIGDLGRYEIGDLDALTIHQLGQ